jgi:hypothetical protein
MYTLANVLGTSTKEEDLTELEELVGERLNNEDNIELSDNIFRGSSQGPLGLINFTFL